MNDSLPYLRTYGIPWYCSAAFKDVRNLGIDIRLIGSVHTGHYGIIYKGKTLKYPLSFANGRGLNAEELFAVLLTLEQMHEFN